MTWWAEEAEPAEGQRSTFALSRAHALGAAGSIASFLEALRAAVASSRSRASQGGLRDAVSRRELRCLELELAILERRTRIRIQGPRGTSAVEDARWSRRYALAARWDAASLREDSKLHRLRSQELLRREPRVQSRALDGRSG